MDKKITKNDQIVAYYVEQVQKKDQVSLGYLWLHY